jgi:hypothetical protein
MSKTGVFTKVLAVAGTVLAWFPVLATILTGAGISIRTRQLRFDYLMPAELFPIVLVGTGLLLWAALRARSRRALIAWGLGLMVAFLVGGQAQAVVTGLASGETEPVGWPWALVLGSIAVYCLAVIEVGVAGVLLVRDLFQHDEKRSGPAMPGV